jgi:AraC family transcriptional regulator, regulatory protein of adaptative response / methylated-DNA-[protein]-cysteine methyltransferase
MNDTSTTPDTRFPGEDERWTAVTQRDAAADGAFFYSVRTTGVYCRPSCASRLARRENVRFHASCADAERAGFRPCKRCRPDRPSPSGERSALVARACRLIDEADPAPDLATLAGSVGLSPHHFHRLFKAETGVTPKGYASARRAERVREQLPGAGSVTRAIYGAGFNSSGRFYAAAGDLLGMKPSEFQRGGAGTHIQFAARGCSLGQVLVGATERGVCAILLGDDVDALRSELSERFPRATLAAGGSDFEDIVARVTALIDEPGRGLELPLDVRGTAFQHRVWQALRAIPAGATASYSELAQAIGAPKAVRAVASACAANAHAVAIPCHRALRSDGELSGYRWGVERKRALLEREAAERPHDRGKMQRPRTQARSASQAGTRQGTSASGGGP